MAIALEDLQRRLGRHEGDIKPANPINATYNHPKRWYKRPDTDSPWGWCLVQLPGDPESYMRYLTPKDEGGKGYTAVSNADAVQILKDQEQWRRALADRVNGEREKEKQEKNHPTFVVPSPEPAKAGIELSPEEYAEFKAFLNERRRQSGSEPANLAEEEGREPRKVYKCPVCTETFWSPREAGQHRKVAHAQA